MPYKVNYGLKRAERNRAKQAKKETKQREREEQAASRAKAKDAESDVPAGQADEGPRSA